MAFKKIEVGVWKPENIGDSIEGVFIKSEENVGENDSMMYTLEVPNGNIVKPVSIWGCAVLDSKMTIVKPGQLIKIEYQGVGESKSGRSPPKIFEVFIDDGEESSVKPDTPEEGAAVEKPVEEPVEPSSESEPVTQ